MQKWGTFIIRVYWKINQESKDLKIVEIIEGVMVNVFYCGVSKRVINISKTRFGHENRKQKYHLFSFIDTRMVRELELYAVFIIITIQNLGQLYRLKIKTKYCNSFIYFSIWSLRPQILLSWKPQTHII